MADYVIVTDNTADLPYSYYKEHGMEYTYLTYTMDGQSYGKDHELEFPDFYARMRNGSMPTSGECGGGKRSFASDSGAGKRYPVSGFFLRSQWNLQQCAAGRRRIAGRISGTENRSD